MEYKRSVEFSSIILLILGTIANGLLERAPSYNSDNLPITRFTCEGKIPSRYYADPDTDCQMFHICARMSRREVSDFKFLCPNGTVFDQELQICADYYQVVCHSNIGTNPLGQAFEIFKLSSKESTNLQEFGQAPVRDPEYLGQQNSIEREEFQAEEYNNNKLASRNTIPYQQQGSSRGGKSQYAKESIFYQQSTTPRLVEKPTSIKYRTTEFKPTTPGITTTKIYETTTTTTPKSVKFSKPIAQEEENYEFNDFASLTKYQNAFHGAVTHATSTRSPVIVTQKNTTPIPPVVYRESRKQVESKKIAKEEEDPFKITDFASLLRLQTLIHGAVTHPPKNRGTTPASVVNVIETRAPLKYNYESTTTRDKGANFNDFASLSKYQAEFHGAVTHATKNTQQPTTTEYYSTTTFSPYVDYTEVSTTPYPTTKKQKSTKNEGNFHFTDFASLSKFQESFHKSYSDPPTTEESTISYSSPSLDFNTRPRSETQPPSDFTTPLKNSIYQSTFRTTFEDISTPSPQTFKQQPTRFNDEFFRKINNVEKEENFQTSPGSVEEIEQNLTTTIRSRGERRRRPNVNNNRQRTQQRPTSDNLFKYSRRVENARFQDNQSYDVKERVGKNDEIFNAEASVYTGPLELNNIYNKQRGREEEVVQIKAEEPVRGDAFGRRIRPYKTSTQENNRVLNESNQGESERKVYRQRKVKIIRTRPSTTSTTTETIINLTNNNITTYRPSFSLSQSSSSQSPNFYKSTQTITSTTTEEPELVTASDEEIARLRDLKNNKNSQNNKNYEDKPALISLKLSAKTPFKAASPRRGGRDKFGGKKSEDYDYVYYDTDREAEYAELVTKGEKYGVKSK